MIAPTPGGKPAEVDSAEGATPAIEDRATTELRVPAPAPAVTPEGDTTPDWTSPEGRAREFLERLGRSDHPDAERDPIHALYQVAIDLRCSAHGYRELYLHHMRHAGD